ncbi:ABC transporter substrate-binding protein [Nocardia noduli]|uniref:ABC transporter substrate-binding protein n=1 Tax=Nocardia noduli TaxID=2815722 RepID=UPI0020B28733|nr:ABC transporter substrate-binding protein [Nocardia noduli]
MATLSVMLTVTMSACSSDDSTSSTAPTADETSLGTPNKATESPVTIGFILDGKSQIADTSDELLGARAAVGYANNYLGGVNGHTIDLKSCTASATSAGTTDCANQMVQARVSAVVVGGLTHIDSVVDTLAAAKIPLFMFGGVTQKALSTPGVFGFYNGMSLFGISAVQAQEVGAKKSAVIAAALPNIQGAAEGLGKIVYGNAGVSAQVVAIPPGTADMTPQISTAAGDTGQFMVLGSDAFCVSSLRAIRTLAPKAAISIPDRCITVGTGNSIPNGYEGMQVSTSGSYDPEAADSKIFIAALAKYGDNGKFGPTAGYGWQPTLALLQALNASKVTDVTPASVVEGVKSAPPLPLPLGAGITYQCNGQQLPLSPNLCGSDGIVATPAKDGSLSGFRKVTLPQSLFSLPRG